MRRIKGAIYRAFYPYSHMTYNIYNILNVVVGSQKADVRWNRRDVPRGSGGGGGGPAGSGGAKGGGYLARPACAGCPGV